MRRYALLYVAVIANIAGCASIETSDPKGFVYYDAVPFFFVSTTTECVATATVVNLPGAQKYLKFNSGYGSSELTAEFDGALLKSVGQTADNKAAETITGVAALVTAAAARKDGDDSGGHVKNKCVATAILYPMVDGKPDPKNPIVFPVPPGS